MLTDIQRRDRRDRERARRRVVRDAIRLAESLVRNVQRQKDNPLSRVVRELLESWIDASYVYSKWAPRDRFERNLEVSRRHMIQKRGEPVRVETLLDVYPLPVAGESLDTFCELQAAEMFLQFITGPYFDKISRCPRCQRFFVNTSGHTNKTYCLTRCARADTATKAVRARREREREERIARVRQALEKFSSFSAERKAKLNQRDWTSSQTGLSKKLVTMLLRVATAKEGRSHRDGFVD